MKKYKFSLSRSSGKEKYSQKRDENNEENLNYMTTEVSKSDSESTLNFGMLDISDIIAEKVDEKTLKKLFPEAHERKAWQKIAMKYAIQFQDKTFNTVHNKTGYGGQ